MANEIKNRVESLIGDTGITSEDAHFAAAINEVMDLLPKDLLMKYAPSFSTLDDSTPTYGGVEGKKILGVTRLDSAEGTERKVTPIELEKFSLAKDSDSLYEATKFSPVYALDVDGGSTTLKMYPEPTADETAKVYYLEYETESSADLSDDTALADFPTTAEYAVVIKTAINLLMTKISDAVQDDEDQEIQTMLQGQLAQLQEMFKAEMSRLSGGTVE